MKSRVYHIAFAALSLGVIWYAGLYLPQQKQHQQLDTQLREIQTQMADFNATIGQLPAFLETRGEVQHKLESMNSRLYAKADVLKLLDRLKADASAYHLRVVEVIPPVSELLELSRAMPMADEPQFLNVTLKMTGGYQAFGEFCQALEHTPFFRGVTACHIGAPPDAGPVQYGLTFKALLGTIKETS